MQLTKGAIGNLINRYKAVLKKCHLLNVFGSLAVAGMLVMGGAAAAGAVTVTTGQDFKDAVTDAEAGATITLGQDIEQGLGAVFDNKDVTVDFAGHRYTAYAGSVGSTGTESQLFQLLKGSTVTLKNGTLDVASPTDESGKFKMVLQNYCDLTLENMVVDGSNLQDSVSYTMSNNHGNVVIKDSTIIAKEGGFAFDVYYWSKYYEDGVSVTATDSTIDGRIEVTVDGNKAIGDNTHSLSISGGTLVGGLTATDGGQLYTVGTTFLSNVAINNNTATNRGGGIYNAVQNASDGGIAGRGQLTLDSVSFSGNKAAQGGAIYNAGTLTADAVSFSNNSATGKGGAIAVLAEKDNVAASLTINGDTFTGNTAGESGGALHLEYASVTISDATFSGNSAVQQGGAIYNDADSSITFKGINSFSDNTAAEGNDIYNAGSIIVADGTTTLGSGLTQVGGEIFVNGGTLDMASGSSLSFDENSTLTIDGGTFVADFDQLLTDYATTNKDNGITDGTSIIGTTGNLNLRLDGGYYTLEDYNAAKGALLGQGEENAALNFLNASLKVDEGQALVVGADKTGNEVTIEMAPVVADAGETPEEAITDSTIPSVPNQIVSVVTNDEDKKLLEADTIKVAGGSEFTAQGLQIADTEGAEAVTLDVTAGSNVTLTGGEAGFTGVVNAEGNAVATNVKIEGDAALTVGLEGNANAQNLVLNEVEVADGSFEVVGNGLDTTQVAANTLTVTKESGTVAVDNASLTVENAVVEDGLLNITNTVADLGTVEATGGVLFFDPSYGNIRNLQDGKLGAKLLVSDGSVVNVGSGLDDLQELAQKAGFSTTALGNDEFILAAGQSMLALGQNVTLDGGQIIVDAGVDASGKINGTPVSDAAYFGKDSLLVVNGSTINGAEAAIDLKNGSLNVQNGAKLLIADAVSGQTYTVITGEANTDTAFNGGAYNSDTSTGWKGDNLLTSSDMLSLTSEDGTVFMVKSEDAHTVFPNLSHELATAVNTLYGQKINDVDADAMGVRFLSRATDNRFLGADKDAAAATIESAARIAFAGAVPQMTKMASDAGSNAVVNRLGFANPADGAQAMDAEGKIVDRNTTGFALWIAPLWQSQHGWGMEAGNLDYGFNGNLGGVSLGADYTFENAIRAGITFNIGGGYAETSGGDLNSTENRMSFWGLGAYAGWNYENFGLMADVSYTSTWNDLKQDMDSRMGMGDLEADVQASAISAGLRAEYKLETSVLDVIPHIGVRYMSLNTWGFDAESNGGTVLEGDGFHQDIWTFPVGVTFTKDFTLDSGWSFKPSIDFSVIPAAGDIKAKQDVAFTGLPGSYEVETQMMDYLTWQGGVGLEMGNDTMSFGVNYTLQAGQHTTGHGVFGSFRYEF